MPCNPSNPYDNKEVEKLWKIEELENEIKEAMKFLDWLNEKIDARMFDKDQGVLNELQQIKQLHEGYLKTIENEYFQSK